MALTWMRHGETGGTQAFPEEALDAWREKGWAECDPPEEPDPAMVEHVPVPIPEQFLDAGSSPASSVVAADAAETEE